MGCASQINTTNKQMINEQAGLSREELSYAIQSTRVKLAKVISRCDEV